MSGRFTKEIVHKDNYTYFQYYDGDKPICDKDIVDILNDFDEQQKFLLFILNGLVSPTVYSGIMFSLKFVNNKLYQKDLYDAYGMD